MSFQVLGFFKINYLRKQYAYGTQDAFFSRYHWEEY